MSRNQRIIIGLTLGVMGTNAWGAMQGAGDGLPSRLRVWSDQQVTRLSLDAEPAFRETTSEVTGARVVPIEGSDAHVVLWSEWSVGGSDRAFYAIDLEPGDERFDSMTETSYVLKLRYARFDPLASLPEIPPHLQAGPGNRLFIVQFVTQPLGAYRDAIEIRGGRIVRFLANHAYIVEMPGETRIEVEGLEFVRWVGDYHPAYRLETALVEAVGDPAASIDARSYNILVTRRGPEEKETVAEQIVAMGGAIDALVPDGFLFQATLNGEQLLTVAAMNEVFYVDRWSEPQTFMNNVRIDGGGNYVEGVAGYTGEGVRAEVMDTGVLMSHQAFQAIPPLIHGANNGNNSHGTAVYGINFGDGTGNGDGRGMVPDAQGIFSSFFSLGNRHTHTAELVAAPYFAVYQTNSWGQCCRTDYGAEAFQMDDITFLNDIVILQAQANNGNRVSSGHAWAKNIVSVGGIRHFNTLTRADDSWTNAGSIGPAEDGRIKPDLAYWYDSILTTSNSGGYTGGFGGTSAATPETAGHFGLMFQMWNDGIFGNEVDPEGTVFDNRPHMATAKALMINTSEPYPFSGPNHDLTRVHQGWGLPSVRNLYDRRGEFFIVDETDILRNLDVTVHQVIVDGEGGALKVTLVYTDLPGTTSSDQHRINDLSLTVISPSNITYYGNQGLLEGNWSTSGGEANHIDTVENVWIENPEAGVWIIEISADEINEDSHLETEEVDADYALVVSGVAVEPPALIIRLPEGVPALIPPGEATEIPVIIEAGAEGIEPGSPTLHHRVSSDDSFEETPLTAEGGDNYSATLPAPRCGDEPEFYFSALGTKGTLITNPANAPDRVYAAIVGVEATPIDDDFERDLGWSVVNEDLEDGAWERAVPFGEGDTAPPFDYDESGFCYVTGNRLFQDIDGGPTRLISPIMDLGSGRFTIQFARWFVGGDGDLLTVELSNDNGNTWTLVESFVSDRDGWGEFDFDPAEFVELTDSMRVRFSAADNPNNSFTEAGLDAFLVAGIECR